MHDPLDHELDGAALSLDRLGVPASWFESAEHADELIGVSLRDLILIAGGLFLIGKSVHEIHEKVERHEFGKAAPTPKGFVGVLVQIALMDLIFSLDSVITAVGMVQEIWVMITAIVIAIGVMLLFADPIGDFVEQHPTLDDVGLELSDPDRRDAGGRRDRNAHRQGLHLLCHGIFAGRRVPEYADPRRRPGSALSHHCAGQVGRDGDGLGPLACRRLETRSTSSGL